MKTKTIKDDICSVAGLSMINELMPMLSCSWLFRIVTMFSLDKIIVSNADGTVDPVKVKKIRSAGIASFLSYFSMFSFMENEDEISKDAAKIAAYNKASKRDLTKQKIVQYAWLAADKILPVAVFAWSRYKDNKKLSEIFSYEDLLNSNLAPVYKMILAKGLADVSEVARKIVRNRVEKGDYKKFFEDCESSGKFPESAGPIEDQILNTN